MTNKIDNRTHESAIAFCALCEQDSRLSELVDKYETDTSSLTAEEFNEMCERMDNIQNNPFVMNMMYQTLEEEDTEEEYPVLSAEEQQALKDFLHEYMEGRN